MGTYCRVLSILMSCLLLAAVVAVGAPLRFVPITLKQPDGTILHVYASGDEFYNWVHDKDNYTILPDPVSGFYVYAEVREGKLVPTEFRVGKVDPQSVGLKAAANVFPTRVIAINNAVPKFSRSNSTSVFPEPNPPVVGSRLNLVIFIRFKGEPEFTDALSRYDNILNGPNGPSVKHFYRETSYNQIDVASYIYPQSSTIVSYQDSQDRNYYKRYDATTNPTGYTNDSGTREWNLLKRALEFVKPQIPSNINLDGNGDGFLDNVIFIVSGDVEAWADLLWPHMSTYPYYDQTYLIEINGEKVRNYNFQIQSQVSYDVLDHEMGHSLGLPDLYRYSNTEISPVAGWDLMVSNSMHMNNYMKWKYLGWIPTLTEITQAGTYWIKKSTSNTRNIYAIKSPKSAQEFFVVEYRSKEGLYEKYIPGSGVLVYRIDNRAIGDASGPPDEIYIYRPNGTLTVNGVLSQANFGSNYNRTQINDLTNPSSFLSDGLPGGLSIKNVGAVGDSMRFDVEFTGNVVDNGDYTTEKTAYNWIDISQDGTTISNWKNGPYTTSYALDDGYSLLPVPLGFNFMYFGQKYSSLYVGINGLVSFTHQFLNFYSSTTPTSATQWGSYTSRVSWPGNSYFPNSLAIAYADFDLSHGGKIMYKTVNDKFILSWLNVGKSTQVDLTNSFQLVLDNSDGSILMNFKSFGQDTTRKQLKVGIQTDTTSGVGWLDSGDWVDRIPADNTAIVFKPKSQFTISTVSSPPSFGTTGGGGTYSSGQMASASLTATPNQGYKFVNWTEMGRIVCNNKVYSFTSYASKSLVANFCVMPSLSVSPSSVDVPKTSGNTRLTVYNVAADGIMTCSVVSAVNWATVTSGGSETVRGAGGFYVDISYQSNPGTARTGTITITADEAIGSPKTFEIRQAGSLLAVPMLAGPADGTKNVSATPVLSWARVAGATAYGLQVALNPLFSTPLVYDLTRTDTTATIGTLQNNMVYYWRVNAKNNTVTSEWSEVRNFTTIVAAPQAPTIVTPINTARNVSLSPALTWSKTVGAATYRLQVSTNSTFSTTLVCDSTTTDTTLAIGPLQVNTTYYWRLSAKNDGGTSAWSQIRSFTTIVLAPTAPVLASPSNGAMGVATTATLSWNASAGATTYRVQLSTSPGFATMVVDDSTLTVTSRQVGPLLNNAIYFWRVSAANTGGASPFSGTWNFISIVAPPAAPTLASPSNSAINVPLNPVLTWNACAEASRYHVQVSSVSSFATKVLEDSMIFETSRGVGPLSPSSSYCWRVRAINAGGGSVFSSTWWFSTVRATSVNQMADNAPKELILLQNYPNPFNPSTTVQFGLPKGGFVTLRVFDALGEAVATLVSQELGPGFFVVRWNAVVPSGIYFYRLQVGEFVETKKMILLR